MRTYLIPSKLEELHHRLSCSFYEEMTEVRKQQMLPTWTIPGVAAGVGKQEVPRVQSRPHPKSW
jgi:hypothetical protein